MGGGNLLSFWLASAIPPLALIILYLTGYLAPPTVESRVDFWSLWSLLLSYYGVLFSALAMYGVRELTDRYFAKIRLPQVKRALGSITTQMAISGERTASEVRKEPFVASISVTLKDVKKVGGLRLNSSINKSLKMHKSMIRFMNDNNNSHYQMNEFGDYWKLFQSLQEITQSIESEIKDQRAR